MYIVHAPQCQPLPGAYLDQKVPYGLPTQKMPKNGRIWEKMHCEISELPKGCPRKKLALEIFSPWARPKKAQNVGNTGPLGQILDLLGMCAIFGL